MYSEDAPKALPGFSGSALPRKPRVTSKTPLSPGSGSDTGVCRLTLDAESTHRVPRRAVLAPGPGGTGRAGAAAVRTKEAERRDYFKGLLFLKAAFPVSLPDPRRRVRTETARKITRGKATPG